MHQSSAALAEFLRFMSLPKRLGDSTAAGPNFRPTVHYRQIALPFAIITTLVGLRLAMELFDWRTGYRTGMVAGIGLIVMLIAIRQLMMLRYNHRLYEQVTRATLRDGLTGFTITAYCMICCVLKSAWQSDQRNHLP